MIQTTTVSPSQPLRHLLRDDDMMQYRDDVIPIR